MAEQNSSEEIDLGYLFRKSNDFLKSVVRSLFLVLDFFKKHYIILTALIIIGFAYGYYKDINKTETYINEVIVIPNYGSVDYLYDKVDAVNLKIKSGDTLFLKEALGNDFGKLGGIELEPIADIFNFVSQSRENIDIFRIIADKQDFSDYLDDIATSKYFKYHRMKFTIKGKESSEEIIENYIAFLNQNEHYQNYQKIFKETKDFEVKEYYAMLTQIDSLIKASSQINRATSSVEINNTTDQHYLIERKRLLLRDLFKIKMDQADYTVPIKTVNVDYNLKAERFLSLSNKVLYPLLLVFLFSMVFFVIYLFRNLRRYSETN